VLLALLGACAAQQQQRPRGGGAQRPEDITIVRYDNENNGDGTYRYAYETSDGTKAEESGYLKPNGNEDPIQVAQGSFQVFIHF
jgi:hypothetical protein